MKSLANEFFSTMAEGAKQHQTDNAASYGLVVNGIKNETDLAEQVNLVEQMIAQQVSAIVIAPADSKAQVTVLKRAKEAGILVVNIDNKLDADVLRERQHGPGRGVRHSSGGQDRQSLDVGFENITALRPLLDKGLVATAGQHGDKLAVFGIEAALKILKGEAPPADQTTAVDLVTK